MKPIHSVAIAAIGTLLLVAIVATSADPDVTGNDAVLVAMGAWAIVLGQYVTMKLLNLKPKAHEKTPPVTPS